MSEPRPPPWFMTFASDELADETFLIATLPQRGYFATLQRWCWVNRDVSADPEEQSLLFGFTPGQIEDAQQCRLISKHFKIRDGRMHCVELDRQRENLRLKHEKLAAAGHKGGKQTQKKRGESKPRLSKASSHAKATEVKCIELNGKEVLQEGEQSTEEFLRQFGDG